MQHKSVLTLLYAMQDVGQHTYTKKNMHLCRHLTELRTHPMVHGLLMETMTKSTRKARESGEDEGSVEVKNSEEKSSSVILPIPVEMVLAAMKAS